MSEASCSGLLGFAVHRTDHTEGTEKWVEGQKTFAATDPGQPTGSTFSTREHPVQSFLWADYSAKPGHDYTFRVVALNGQPDALTEYAEASVDISTESPLGQTHHVFFNRGVAASQEYARRFDNKPPEEAGQAAWDWLSRGLYEAMRDFVRSVGPGEQLRIAAYEFHYAPFLDELKQAVDRGVDLKVVYDHRNATFPGPVNDERTAAAGIAHLCTPRLQGKSAISHNKFMVHVKDGSPVSVWTGGTNFSSGGIFGQSNVGQIVADPDVAATYLAYWELLATDPQSTPLKPKVDTLTPVPTGKPPVGVTAIFSPRGGLDALEWYSALAMEAESALFMAFAFGMNDRFKQVYAKGAAPLRFAVMEKAAGPGKPDRVKVENEAIRKLRFQKENLIAIGSTIGKNELGGWYEEKLSGLNSHVNYIHNKFMVIDPLSDDPIVVGGSANFSNASTTENDENMIVIRGNTRVADIYLGEFMRLYSHHAFRELVNQRGTPELRHLRTDDWWKVHFGDTSQSRRRVYFSGAAA
jgi:phosphatidylserine/phosphatidylglycerophosphate/cardiolipin synthase-like enzyme